jgi:geranylgeranyl diphosphate synthase type II
MTSSDYRSDRILRLAELLEGELRTALPAHSEPGRADFGRTHLLEAMEYSLRTPGKRIRPLLLLCAAEVVGTNPEPLVRFACGLEMIHAYSLVHDDLPAMDDDDLRRGQPTNHVVYGEGMAILAGDGLLTHAAVIMMDPVADCANQMAVARDIMVAAGCDGMVGGQAADLMAEGGDPDVEVLAGIHRRKTGALIHAAVRGGALLGGAGADALRALDAFGTRFGLAFQIADDVKDEVAPTEVTGKRPGGDREAGKMTYPSLLGISDSVLLCESELAAAISELANLGPNSELLATLATDAITPALAPARS